MLEKIGLPAKPALRGNVWVVDASHCQGCAAQFTFINRKHHCRRCGGIFCNTCTQQRMVLRGQGDSPVRICEPCKQAEEAAKFERRYGAKSKAGKADSKQGDALLRELLSDGKDILSSRQGSLSSVSGTARSVSSASSSTAHEELVQDERKEVGHIISTTEFKDALEEMGSASPEKLRQQAMEEKNKFKILKANGKSGEALKAFKRGKELEREAAALELSLRKNRKKVAPSISMTKTDSKVADTDSNPAPPTRKEKDDISAELRELGWSDMELHGADKKTGTMSLEGELSTLIGETFQNGKANKGSSVIDKSEVIAMKRKALALKREGKMAEAKEELKKAKILEKELEEQELLAEADDSDDEFASLIKSMDSDKPDDLLIADVQVPALDIDQLMRMADDVGEDGEVTEADLDDPEITAALQSFGWSEDASPPEKTKPHAEPMDHESLLQQIQSLKREALNNKRAGNMTEAMSLLKKAKQLEKELDAVQVDTSELFLKSNKGSTAEESDTPTVEQFRPTPKSKIVIQRELLALKKKALSLRREGKLDEAEYELKKAKILEHQLEEIGSISKENVSQVVTRTKEPDLSSIMEIDGQGGEEDVTENDLHDPTYLSLLSNLGWKDDDAEIIGTSSNPPLPDGHYAEPTIDTHISPESVRKPVALPRRSKAELQRELLGLKRKALTLRRQGQNEEAEEVLNSAKSLEEQLAVMEVPKTQPQAEFAAPLESVSMEVLHEPVVEKDAKATGTLQSRVVDQKIEVEPIIQSTRTADTVTVSSTPQKEKTISSSASPPRSSRDRFKLQQKSLAHKRQAMKLRREGRTEEADAEFQLAKEIENQLENSAPQSSSAISQTNVGMVEDLLDPQLMSALKSIGITDSNPPSQSQARAERPKPVSTQPNSLTSSSSQERTELEQQIKAEKVKAVTLKREGKQAEALNTLRHAKMLEKKLNLLPS